MKPNLTDAKSNLAYGKLPVDNVKVHGFATFIAPLYAKFGIV